MITSDFKMGTSGLKRNTSTEESRKFWDGVDRTAARVDSWPAWMRGEISDNKSPKKDYQMTKILKTDLDEYWTVIKAVGPYHEKILNRINYILRTTYKEFGGEIDWWDFENYDGNAYTLEQCLGKTEVTNLDVRVKGSWDDLGELIIKLDDGDYCEFTYGFPIRWLHEDFEDELSRGKATQEKEVAAEKKAKADKRAAKKAAKEKLKALAAAKLTPEERKALGLK